MCRRKWVSKMAAGGLRVAQWIVRRQLRDICLYMPSPYRKYHALDVSHQRRKRAHHHPALSVEKRNRRIINLNIISGSSLYHHLKISSSILRPRIHSVITALRALPVAKAKWQILLLISNNRNIVLRKYVNRMSLWGERIHIKIFWASQRGV